MNINTVGVANFGIPILYSKKKEGKKFLLDFVCFNVYMFLYNCSDCVE